MSVPKLSIVIPTHNRSEKIPTLLDALSKLINSQEFHRIEIVISDNFSNPPVEVSKSNPLYQNIRVIRPEKFLLTAEENLVFAISKSDGEYCWILGDDDMPIESGLSYLFSIINSNNYDLLIFNSLAQNPQSGKWEINRINLSQIIESQDLLGFVNKAGFWSVTAGFSTLVFRRSLFDLSFIVNLFDRELRIYSHVTTLLHSFINSKFAAIAIPLVKYGSNAFDSEDIRSEIRDNHWIEYANLTGKPFRFPWTTSFLMQLQILESSKRYDRKSLFTTMDQSHLGERFFLLDSILAMLIDQIIYEMNNPNAILMKETEISFCFEFLRKIDPQIDSILDSILEARASKESKVLLGVLRSELVSPQKQLERREICSLSDGKIYQTPYGYLWTPLPINMNVAFRNLSKPSFGIIGKDFSDLDKLIKIWRENNPFTVQLPLEYTLNISGLNSLVVKIDKLSKLIPKFLRKVMR